MRNKVILKIINRFEICENAWFEWRPNTDVPTKLLIYQLLLISDYLTWYQLKAWTQVIYPFETIQIIMKTLKYDIPRHSTMSQLLIIIDT